MAVTVVTGCVVNSSEIGSRTIPQSPPDKNKAQLLPIRTTFPRTTPHQDNSPSGPLQTSKTIYQVQYLYGGELSWWGVVQIQVKSSQLCCSAIWWIILSKNVLGAVTSLAKRIKESHDQSSQNKQSKLGDLPSRNELSVLKRKGLVQQGIIIVIAPLVRWEKFTMSLVVYWSYNCL